MALAVPLLRFLSRVGGGHFDDHFRIGTRSFCRAGHELPQCHLVDEKGYGPFRNLTLSNRTFCDFAQRSPAAGFLPARAGSSGNIY